MRSKGQRVIQTKIGTLSKLLRQHMSAGWKTVVVGGLHVRGLPKARLSLGEPLNEQVLGLHLVFHCPQLPLMTPQLGPRREL